jgi:hypothetical protein
VTRNEITKYQAPPPQNSVAMADLAPRIYPLMVHATKMYSLNFPLFEDIYVPQHFPSTTYLSLLVSLPTRKFFKPSDDIIDGRKSKGAGVK